MRLARVLLVMSLGACVLGLGGSLSPAAATVKPAAAAPVTIMPLGDSITYGTNSTDGNGYREALRQLLLNDSGTPIDYVGSQRSGTSADPDNEGHPGYRIDAIADYVDGWLATYHPQVVLLNIGTNDMIQNYDLPNAPARLGALIDQIVRDDPTASVLVSSIIPNGNATTNADAQTYNAAIPGLVTARAMAGDNVRFVDMNSRLTTADLGSDGIHPSDAGYVKMAGVWYSALQPVLGGGRNWPLFSDDFEAGSPPVTWTNDVHASVNVGGYCCGLTSMESGVRSETAHSGSAALMYSGDDTSAVQSYSYNQVFDVFLPVQATTVLSYWIYPQAGYPNSTSVAIDLGLTDGRDLRDSGAVDQYGVRAHPQYQGEGGHLVPGQWNQVQVKLAPLAGGTIDQILLGYDQPANTGPFRGYVDDIQVVNGPVEDGAITSGVAGKCLDDNGGSTANGAHIQSWSCNGSAAQRFFVPGDGTLRIAGGCVDATSGGTGNGTLVQLWGCDGTGSQQWIHSSSTNALVNPQSGRCLDVPAASTTDGTRLQLYDCNGTAAQSWTLPTS
jgi:lysophospholipase L1-like esterase